MEYVLYLGFLIAIGCWVTAAAHSLAIHSHVKPGKRLALLVDPAIWWNPTVAAHYLTDQGLARLKQTKIWILRFLGMIVVLAVLLVSTAL